MCSHGNIPNSHVGRLTTEEKWMEAVLWSGRYLIKGLLIVCFDKRTSMIQRQNCITEEFWNRGCPGASPEWKSQRKEKQQQHRDVSGIRMYNLATSVNEISKSQSGITTQCSEKPWLQSRNTGKMTRTISKLRHWWIATAKSSLSCKKRMCSWSKVQHFGEQKHSQQLKVAWECSFFAICSRKKKQSLVIWH